MTLVEVELGPLFPGFRQALFSSPAEADGAVEEMRSHIGTLIVPWGDVKAVRAIPLTHAQASAWRSMKQ